MKELSTALQDRLFRSATLTYKSETLNFCVQLAKQDDSKEKTKLVSIGDGECHLPFWGRISDLKTFSKVSNRANILDLGKAGGRGPLLFLDGEQYVNQQRIDCCVGWLISPVPQRKKMHTESRDEQDPVATNRVSYTDVELEMSWSEKVVFNALSFITFFHAITTKKINNLLLTSSRD